MNYKKYQLGMLWNVCHSNWWVSYFCHLPKLMMCIPMWFQGGWWRCRRWSTSCRWPCEWTNHWGDWLSEMLVDKYHWDFNEIKKLFTSNELQKDQLGMLWNVCHSNWWVSYFGHLTKLMMFIPLWFQGGWYIILKQPNWCVLIFPKINKLQFWLRYCCKTSSMCRVLISRLVWVQLTCFNEGRKQCTEKDENEPNFQFKCKNYLITLILMTELTF